MCGSIRRSFLSPWLRLFPDDLARHVPASRSIVPLEEADHGGHLMREALKVSVRVRSPHNAKERGREGRAAAFRRGRPMPSRVGVFLLGGGYFERVSAKPDEALVIEADGP